MMTRFTTMGADAQVPTCAASRASFFTARYPDRTRVLESFSPYWRVAGGNFTSIPQYFKESGFESIGIGVRVRLGH